jgi:hypothetical protein
MADNSGAEKSSSSLREIARKIHPLWWTAGAVVLIAFVGVAWLERKRVHFPSDWSLPVGLTAGALLALAILWKVPQWQVGRVRRLNAKERFDRVNEARKTLAQILGGIVLLAGFFGTWQNIKVAQESFKVSQEGQITDRFSKAIEQLGAIDSTEKKKLEVRLGGIYALEGIANESKELHWPIMEVLCTYIRVNAPIKPQESPQENQTATASPQPEADIQAILTVLGRRDQKQEKKSQHLDLNNVDIRGADLTGAGLTGTGLAGANLSGANLSGVYLTEASLSGAYLSGAYLNAAYLVRANLSGANLSRANLNGTDLDGENLSGAKGLTQGQVNAAQGNSDTQLPENLHRPERWKK